MTNNRQIEPSESSENNLKNAKKYIDRKLDLANGIFNNVDNFKLDIFDNGRLIKMILRYPQNDSPRVGMRNIAKVNLLGCYGPNKKVFDSRSSYEFVVGHSEVILGIDASVALMKVGEISDISIDSAYGFGSINWFSNLIENSNDTVNVPPNTTLKYIIEVISVEPYPEPSLQSSNSEIDQIIYFCNRKRIWANMWYNYGIYATSSHIFEIAFNALNRLDYEYIPRVKALYIIIGNNLAASKIKEDKHSEVINILSYITKNEPNNIKAIYRLATCLQKLGNLEECYEFLKKLIANGMSNVPINELYRQVKNQITAENSKLRESYSKIFHSAVDSNSYISSTQHSFITPKASLNGSSEVNEAQDAIPISSTTNGNKFGPCKTYIVHSAIIGGSLFVVLFSYYYYFT